MIDIHNHLLPGTDDGAKTLLEAVEMARIAASDGVRIIAVSPHYQYGERTNTLDEVRRRVDQMRELLESEGVPIRLLPGAEVPVSMELVDMIRNRTVPTIGDNGRWVLLELPFGQMPPRMPEVVFRMKAAGYDPVLAHPERNSVVQQDPNSLDEHVPEDTPLQITTHSLTGQFGSAVKRCALRLLTSGRPVLLASDAHGARERGPALSPALLVAARAAGQEFARALVEDVPAALLRGEALPAPPREQRRRGFLSSLFSKVRG